MDLCFVDDLTAIPFVDLATRFTFISKIDNKEPETVWTDLMYTWIKRDGLPEQITCALGASFPPTGLRADARMMIFGWS